MQVVCRVDEQAAYRRADHAAVDVGRIGRCQFGGPFARDRTAGVSEQRNLRLARQRHCRSVERGADRIEGVHPVLGARGEVGSLALGVGHDHREALREKETEDRQLDVRNDAAERQAARDRIRRLIVAIKRIVGGLVRNHLRPVAVVQRLDDGGDVYRRLSGLARRPVEQLRGLQRGRDAQHVVRNARVASTVPGATSGSGVLPE